MNKHRASITVAAWVAVSIGMFGLIAFASHVGRPLRRAPSTLSQSPETITVKSRPTRARSLRDTVEPGHGGEVGDHVFGHFRSRAAHEPERKIDPCLVAP